MYARRDPIFWTRRPLVQWWESRKNFNFTQLLLLHFLCEHASATPWGETPWKCALSSPFGRFFVSCPSVGFSPRLRVWPFANSHKHLCLQTRSDNMSHKLVPFEHTLAFMRYWQGTRHLFFLFASVSHLILPISWATLTEMSEVSEQQGVWSVTFPLGTGSGQENEGGRDNSSIYTLQLGLTSISHQCWQKQTSEL